MRTIKIIIFIFIFSGFVLTKDKIKMPEFKSKNPKFVDINLMNDKILRLVLDESKGTDKGYDILYADSDFDDDLTNDRTYEIIEAISMDKQKYFYYGMEDIVAEGVLYKIRINDNDGSFSISVSFSLTNKEGDEKWTYLMKFKESDNEKKVFEVKNKMSLFLSHSIDKEKGLIRIWPYLWDGGYYKDGKNRKFPLISISRDNKNEAPEYVIIDNKSNVIAKGAFDRGGELNRFVSGINIPEKGEYTIKVKYDTGPLYGKLQEEQKIKAE